jgi:hypothetical protein
LALAGLAFRRGLLAAGECHHYPQKYGTLNAWHYLPKNLNRQRLLKLPRVAMQVHRKLVISLRTRTV